MMNFLNNLDALLANNHMTRAELSRRVNIAPSTINSWYNKGYENISLRFILKIADYFSVSLDEIVNGEIERIDDIEYSRIP